MNSETAETISTSTGNPTAGLNGGNTVHRVAQKAHEAVDKLESTVGTSAEKVLSLQQEYGDMCRDHVKANPLISIGAAFAAGVVFSKLFLR
ncbi:MAG: hypothetical protein ABIT82_02600 [Ramlibacter sp.]